MNEYSVGIVMSYWEGDQPSFIEHAINSILTQTIIPNSIILVRDGKVSYKTERIVNQFLNNKIIEHVILPENKGRGIARHTGVLKCKCNLIALMDSDDISESFRIEKQVNFLKKNKDIDIVGGYIHETDGINKDIYRTVPLAHDAILKRGRFTQPFNHVTIMFRKNSYLKSGGYGSFRIVEDYDFFHKLYLSGSRFANIPEVLVKVRTNGQQYKRQGYKYFREELSLQLLMYKSNYIKFLTLIRNLMIRIIFRAMPGRIQTFFTKRLLRKSTKI